MKRILLLATAILVAGAGGCVSRTPDTAPPAKVRWYRNAAGYIVSGIEPRGGGVQPTDRGSPGQLRDPLEDVPEFKEAFAEADRLARIAMAPYQGQEGAVHIYWEHKQRVLREKYRIDWKTPAELNPHILYD